MKIIWPVLFVTACLCAVLTGRAETAGTALLASAGEAVTLALQLAGSMTLWSGLLEILDACGDVARLGRGLRRWLAPLFGGLSDDASWEAICMNLSANIAGLGNAATPAGLRAAKLLSAQGETGARALAMLLVLNNSSLQLIPTTVISLRAAAGSTAPAEILPVSVAASLVSTVTAAGLMLLLQRGGVRYAHHRDHRADRSARQSGRS